MSKKLIQTARNNSLLFIILFSVVTSLTSCYVSGPRHHRGHGIIIEEHDRGEHHDHGEHHDNGERH